MAKYFVDEVVKVFTFTMVANRNKAKYKLTMQKLFGASNLRRGAIFKLHADLPLENKITTEVFEKASILRYGRKT